jgi:hypothetical protein
VDLRDLVRALLAHDALGARQWVADAERARLSWATMPEPRELDARAMAVAAGVAELLAGRSGQLPPAWTASVPAAAEPVWLVRAALTLPRLRRMCELEGPEPLRRRRVLAPPEFLTVA